MFEAVITMKRIGIVFAMKEELDELLKKLRLVKEYQIFDLVFYECKYKNIECILVESGIGKVNAARSTQILIDNMKVDCIFNIGVAGGVSDKLNVGDIVIGDKLVQHDFDLTAFNHNKGYIPNVGDFIHSDDYLISLATSCMNDGDYKSLQAVISDPETMKYYQKPYDEAGVQKWIDWCKASQAKRGFGLWSVILKETGQM